jgi:uncharacterized membrane protein
MDTHRKSLIKAFSWRAVGSLDTFILSFIITKEVKMATSIAAVELFTKIILYWIHERIWLKIRL